MSEQPTYFVELTETLAASQHGARCQMIPGVLRALNDPDFVADRFDHSLYTEVVIFGRFFGRSAT